MLILPEPKYRRRRAKPRSDTPPAPPPPVEPANVIGSGIESDGFVATLTFDRPLALGPGSLDGSIRFDGQIPVGSELRPGNETIAFTLDVAVGPGSTWEINAQPPWIVTPLAVPQGGNL